MYNRSALFTWHWFKHDSNGFWYYQTSRYRCTKNNGFWWPSNNFAGKIWPWPEQKLVQAQNASILVHLTPAESWTRVDSFNLCYPRVSKWDWWDQFSPAGLSDSYNMVVVGHLTGCLFSTLSCYIFGTQTSPLEEKGLEEKSWKLKQTNKTQNTVKNEHPIN